MDSVLGEPRAAWAVLVAWAKLAAKATPVSWEMLVGWDVMVGFSDTPVVMTGSTVAAPSATVFGLTGSEMVAGSVLVTTIPASTVNRCSIF